MSNASVMNTLSRYVFHPLLDLKEGSGRLRILRELERTQWMPLPVLLEKQKQRLAEIVRHAGTTCPYYERLFREQQFDCTDFDIAAFRKLPVLTKADIRASTDDLVSREYDRESLGFHKTGGSTGVSLTTYFDKNWLEERTADSMRANQWARWYHGSKLAAIWGNPPTPSSLKGRLRSALLDRMIYLDTMNLNDETMGRFVATWRREQPQVLFGHSHSIFILASYVRDHGITDLRPDGIVSTSMMLLAHERAVIEAAFGCKVTDRYGSEEVGLIACECEKHEGYHLNVEYLLVEFLRPDGTAAPPGEEGTVVVTDLLNRGMPLIRYRVEDVGVPSERACSCGRSLPLMERVTGRVADYLKRRDGSMVAGVSLVERTLTAIPGLEQMQIVQSAMDELIVNVVRAPDFAPTAERALFQEFNSVFGDSVTVRVQYVERIPQERSGKYRFSICKV